MRKITKLQISNNGNPIRVPVKLSKKLNYNIADLLNQSVLNEYGLPEHHCNPPVLPDYIALNSEPSKFHKTPLTAVAFYNYDKSFDTINGLYNAIYYNDKKLLTKYEKKYRDVKFVIAPDYSLFDDIWQFENNYRLFKIRIIMLWFVIVIKAVVIPNVPYLATEQLPMYLSGFKNCSVMCFSTKSHIRYKTDRTRIKDTVKYVVDQFDLKVLLVYSVCGKDSTSLELFNYAVEKGIKVVILDNTMRRRNQERMKGVIV